MWKLPIFAAILACQLPAQLMVNTVAGGYIPSGIAAQNAVIGVVEGTTLDPNGNIVFCDYVRNVIRRIRSDGTIETIAGTGVSGYAGDGGLATAALLNGPSLPQFDSAGNLYFADSLNYRLRRIASNGVITTAAGTGVAGTLGMDGPATSAQIEFVHGLAIDAAGNVYFSEWNSSSSWIRRLTTSGQIEVFAGNGQPGSNGDGGPALSASFSPFLTSLAFDDAGNLYAADDDAVRRISFDGTINTLSDVNVGAITGLTADKSGNVYVSGFGPPTALWEIAADGDVQEVAGPMTTCIAPSLCEPTGLTSDGPANNALLSVSSLAADGSGNVYFADGEIIPLRIRKLTPQSTIQTVAGSSPLSAPDGTPALESWFVTPSAIAVGKDGDLYVAEQGTCLIRKIGSDGLLATVAGTGTCAASGPGATPSLPELTPPGGLAVDSQGQVYMADTAFGSNIYAISPNGTATVLETFPLTAIAVGSSPRLAIDSQDKLYVAAFEGSELLRFSPNGSVEDLSAWIRQLGALAGTVGMSIDPADNLYILTLSDNNELPNYIYRINQSGAATLVSAVSIPNLEALNSVNVSVAADSSGDLWMAGYYNFLKFTGASQPGIGQGISFGQELGPLGDAGPAEAASYDDPSSLAFAPNGDLYVLDTGNNRVRKISGAPPQNAPSFSAAGVVNAASLMGGAIAPGELISIFGTNLGPAQVQNFTLINNTIPPFLSNVHVFLTTPNGSYYASAITAISANQINVFVPYEIAGASSVGIVVDIDTVRSASVMLPVANAAFGLFSANSSGSGEGAILNQDGSYNSSANPAAPGSVITLFGTGEGVTTPQLPDGALVISTPFSVPQQPVSVTIGGQLADVLYAGAAPFEATGILQLNVRAPNGVSPGDAPILVTVGNKASTQPITCAVY